MKTVTTVIIGAGQSGLAMSKHLADRSIDHVLLERGEVANAWRTERWDSLRLLTPNWQSRLPGYAYSGDDPDGYMAMPEVTGFLQSYADTISAPVQTGTTVTSVRQTDGGYNVGTNRGDWRCPTLVLANGACGVAAVPKVADGLPPSVRSMTPLQYRNPRELDTGTVLVVGASATGVQLAQEIQASGRQVILSVGEHVRLPRLYRGRDIKWWMDVTGVMDMHYHEVDDIRRARRVPSLQLVGTPERATLDINTLRDSGVEIVGRLAGLRDGEAMFSGSLGNQCTLADLKMNRLLDTIDEWVSANARNDEFEPPHRFEPTQVATAPRLGMDLADGGVKTVVWATGYRPDYSWLDVPVFDRKGRIRHDGGVVDAPGLYVMGLPFLRRRKSSFIDGAGDDARDLAAHLGASLHRPAA
ncbi:MAG: pyridine nucleotide-disulfide oxidoreductase [Alphaproteobacteria bacterium]|nr:pyridine nucleotide-disulfide oxidoreductase [Alphaproteobacteria bacterium]